MGIAKCLLTMGKTHLENIAFSRERRTRIDSPDLLRLPEDKIWPQQRGGTQALYDFVWGVESTRGGIKKQTAEKKLRSRKPLRRELSGGAIISRVSYVPVNRPFFKSFRERRPGCRPIITRGKKKRKGRSHKNKTGLITYF